MNKNFLIVFTEGKDKYNLEKQLKNFSECDIYRYNCKPDYDLLYENAKIAYEKGYESFYYLTESADWEELDKDFRKEFYMFKEARVIKGNYGPSRLKEADQNQQKVAEELIGIFPANFAHFDNNEKLDIGFVKTLNEYFQAPRFIKKFLVLPLPQSQVGLTAGEAFALFNDIAKQNKLNIPNEYLKPLSLNIDIISTLGCNNPVVIGPNDLVQKVFANRANSQNNQKGNFGVKQNDSTAIQTFNSYSGRAQKNVEFAQKLEGYINKLKTESQNSYLTSEDEKIINNIGSELKTEKQQYVINCFNTAIFNQENNINITINNDINISIENINIQSGMDQLAKVTGTLLDVEGNLQATQGTIYNSAIQAARAGAKMLFNVDNTRDNFYKNSAQAKGALSNLTGIDIDDSFETSQLNKSKLKAGEVEARSDAKAKLAKDREVSKLNIEDTKKKIQILMNKIKSTNDENLKKQYIDELESEKENLKLYQSHYNYVNNEKELQLINAKQSARAKTSAGEKDKQKDYNNASIKSDEEKIKRAKNVKGQKSLNKKMNARLLSKNNKGTRPLDDLVASLG